MNLSLSSPILLVFPRHPLNFRILRGIAALGLLGLFAVVLFATGCTPSANLKADITSGAAPLTVTFSNTTSAFFSKADEFHWNFGDGGTATSTTKDEPVTHEFTKAGDNTVTLTAIKQGNPPKTTSKTLVITVEHGALGGVKITPEQAGMAIGQSQEFTAVAVDAYDNPIPEAPLNWTAAPDAGALSGTSLIAGTKAGIFDRGIVVTSSFEANTAEGTASVTVSPDPLDAVVIPETEVAAGETRQLEVAATDQYGNRVTEMTPAWTGTNEDAGSVTPDGMFTADKVAGTYANTVKVRVTQGDKTLEAEAPLTVVPDDLEQVVIGPDKAEIGMGMTQQFVAVGADRYGNRITGLEFTWNLESGGGVITPGGLFTAGDNAGTYTIQAQATQGDITKAGSTGVNVLPDRIAFLSEGKTDELDIYIMGVDGTDLKRLTTSGIDLGNISVSPDGRRIVFRDDNGLFTINDDGTRKVSLTDLRAYEPAWSPNGSKIAFQSWENDLPEIYMMDADGSNLVRLTDNSAYDDYPAWSPDGSKIVFVSDRDGNNEIYVMNADGSNQRRLTNSPESDTFPVWSPDGTKILFQSDRSGRGIYVMNSDGTSVSKLTANSYSTNHPSWSSDGSKIAFHGFRDSDEAEIYIMNRDGSNIIRLTNNTTNDYSPYWMPRKAGVEVNEDSIIIPDASRLKDLTAQEVTSRARAAVVRIKTDLGSGSGFLISPDGLILTANHVISGSKEITVYLSNGTSYQATVKSRDMVRDLATIEIKAANLPYLEFGDLSRVALGQTVIVLGYPLGNESVSVTSGLVSTIDYDGGRNITWVQTDSAVNPGNSGGPLLNLRGQVIGIITSKMVGSGVEGIGFAISANTVNTYLPQLK
ncbi:MAG: DUF5050 domain-containing protein [Dehalococcoidia bacterium]|nr:MAG: DUF5050 domain-containing protein [Dehalococcoidia bacterium]